MYKNFEDIKLFGFVSHFDDFDLRINIGFKKRFVKYLSFSKYLSYFYFWKSNYINFNNISKLFFTI